MLSVAARFQSTLLTVNSPLLLRFMLGELLYVTEPVPLALMLKLSEQLILTAPVPERLIVVYLD